jgi:carboxyl-terminal processing protease
MFKKSIISLTTILLVFSCMKKSEGLKQSDIPLLINQFLAMHVEYNTFDDTISERTLDNYISSLDYGKYYFYQSDIKEFDKFKDQIDDDISNKRFSIIFDIFNRYKQRAKENMKLFDQIIAGDFNFKQDEFMIIDRDKVEYPRDINDMKERWRKNIKLQLLNYLSAGKNLEEAKKKLKKKYELLQKRIDEFDEDKILAQFMNAFSTALDPHSNYLSQDEHEDFKISMELKLEGIGVRLSTEDGFVIVESIIPGGATDKLPENIRLKPNDKIVAVAQKDAEPVDVIDMDLRDVVKMIRGKKGTEVLLTIIRDTGTSNEQKRMVIPIVREEINLKDSDAESDIFIYGKDQKKKIGYIKLPSFYQDPERDKSSAGDIRTLVDQLKSKGARAIILDLRGNPGGLLNEAIDIAGLFIKKGPIVQIKEGLKPAHIIYDDDDLEYSGPIIILINKFSASASEILAGAIKDFRRGIIIGPNATFGKGTVQSYNVLPFEKGAVKITTHIFYQPGGTSNQLNGIAPDIDVPDLSSIWDVGEDKSRYPLKWKKIPSAGFTPLGLVSPAILETLSKKSQARIASDPKFKEMLTKIAKFKKQLSDKSISLKEESAIEEQKKKELEKNLNNDKTEKIIDLENDIFLGEVFNITSDYIDLLKK